MPKPTYDFLPFNFGALHHQNFDLAKVVILPVPYSGTVSFGSGTEEGPHEIIKSSGQIDELECFGGPGVVGFRAEDIFTLEELSVSKNSPEEAVEGIESAVSEEIVKKDKIPFMLGGEHTITLGVVRALKKKYQDLSVLQFDAHTDLMNSWEGTKYSHACVMRRIQEMKIKTVALGIRNFNLEVNDYIKKNKIKHIHKAPGLPPLKKVLSGLTKNVYLTFDLDVLDPSIMPAVGTSEPGGLLWQETIDFIKKLSQQVNIVGADVVELAPIAGLTAPNFLAAKLVYKIIASILG